MPAFLDPEHFTVRGGPEATGYGKPWRSCCSMTIQHDRSVYLYAIAGQLPVEDFKAAVAAIKAEAPKHGWTEIIWHRERRHKDGTPYTHLVRIALRPTVSTAKA